eukprot:163072-Pyramimonas_sp.AAC.1
MLSGAVGGGVTSRDLGSVAREAAALSYELKGRSKLVVKDALFKLAAHLVKTECSVLDLLKKFDSQHLGQ